ncbi:hypothetical protein [Paenibacillus silvisoli]|uniref:hypothetical protein n=1 Tax=Paenibacillus silvisoli TaxID=3110539 RepID=UPI0028038980|nr:hypothetical protein [Paenibacillus silvisoli]
MSDIDLTADELAKISATLAILGYGIGLLALSKQDTENQEKESATATAARAAIHPMINRFRYLKGME